MLAVQCSGALTGCMLAVQCSGALTGCMLAVQCSGALTGCMLAVQCSVALTGSWALRRQLLAARARAPQRHLLFVVPPHSVVHMWGPMNN
jgi:hypothetical protein